MPKGCTFNIYSWLRQRWHTPKGHRRAGHLSFLGLWAHRSIDHWVRDAWPVWHQTYGYLSSRRASPPFDHWYQIILLGEQRGTCAWTTCPRSLPGSALTQSRSWDFSVISPARYCYTTKPRIYRWLDADNMRYCCQKQTTYTVVLCKRIDGRGEIKWHLSVCPMWASKWKWKGHGKRTELAWTC